MDPKILGAAVIVLVAIAAWCPWLSQESAESAAVTASESAWKGVTDCTVDCNGCGAVWSQKMPFGYSVTLAHYCGMPESSRTPPQQATVFVTFFGTVYGIPGL